MDTHVELTGQYLERFLARIVKGPGCWEWNGAHTAAGYAETWNGKRPILAHRVSYQHFVGPIPEGLTIDHLCRNRGCVRPDHLEPVSHAENMRRGNTVARMNANKTHCPLGHPYDTVLKNGGRACRECWRIKNRRRFVPSPKVPKSHCPQGHPYDGENTYVSKRGDRMCRECMRERTREWRARKKAEGSKVIEEPGVHRSEER